MKKIDPLNRALRDYEALGEVEKLAFKLMLARTSGPTSTTAIPGEKRTRGPGKKDPGKGHAQAEKGEVNGDIT